MDSVHTIMPTLADRPGLRWIADESAARALRETTRPRRRRVAPVEPDPRPVYPIGSFFNAARLLVWPSESPATDD